MIANSFIYNASSIDEGFDPEWQLIKNQNITVQDATAYGGGYVVNEIVGEGEDWGSIYHGEFKSKIAAFKYAIKIAK